MIDRLLDEVVRLSRGTVQRALVLAVDDAGEAQTLTVQTHDGVVRDGVEVLSIHGLATRPGVDGTALLLAVGGDQGHYVALPCQDFGARFGGMPAGGAALYDDAGNRLAFPGDGSALLTVALLFRVVAETMRIDTQAGLTVHGPVTFADDVLCRGNLRVLGNLVVGGSISAGGSITANAPMPVAPGPGLA